jgi:hypothetical protein
MQVTIAAPNIYAIAYRTAASGWHNECVKNVCNRDLLMKNADMRATNKSEPRESLEGCFVQMRQ